MMKIIKLEQSKKPRAIEIRAILGDTEFGQLLGALDELCVFSTADVKEPAGIIKSGKRSQFAKYALIPISIRHDHKTDEYDFSQLKAGAVNIATGCSSSSESRENRQYRRRRRSDPISYGDSLFATSCTATACTPAHSRYGRRS